MCIWFVICSHIHIHWTLRALYRSGTRHSLSLSLDVSTEKSVALYITVMGRLKSLPKFWQKRSLDLSLKEVVKIECRQVGIIKPCRAGSRRFAQTPLLVYRRFCTPPIAIQWPVHHIGYHRYTGNDDDDIHYSMQCHKDNQSSPPQCKWQTKRLTLGSEATEKYPRLARVLQQDT